MHGKAPAGENGEEIRVRTWDLPTRLFHWTVVGLFAFSWWTAENDELDWHKASGYVILALVLFRIYWGFVGSTSARFAAFLRGPAAFFDYARRLLHRSGDVTPGHNPMGGWSVVAMLLLLLLQTVLGLFTIDVEGYQGGPLSHLVTFDTGRKIAHWHETVFDLLLVLTGLHLAAVIFYLAYKRENLVAAMLSGFKRMPPGVGGPTLHFARIWLAIPGLVVAGLLVAWIVYGRF